MPDAITQKDYKIDLDRLTILIQRDYTPEQRRYARLLKDYTTIYKQLQTYLKGEWRLFYKTYRMEVPYNLVRGVIWGLVSFVTASSLALLYFRHGVTKDLLAQIILLVVFMGSSLATYTFFRKIRRFNAFRKIYFEQIALFREKLRELRREFPHNVLPPKSSY